MKRKSESEQELLRKGSRRSEELLAAEVEFCSSYFYHHHRTLNNTFDSEQHSTMDPNRAHVVPAALPPAQPSSASSSTPAPLKLTFRLGAAGGGVSAAGPSLSAPAPSTSHATFAPSSAASVATTLSPASEPMDRDDNMSVMSDAGSVLGAARVASPVPRPPPGTVSVPVKLPPGEKPKRKRAPKRPPGEVGPGKHWRKGLKGCARK